MQQFVWVWTSELSHTPLLEKKEKTKFCGRFVESVVFQKTVIESTFDYWIKAEYEYWIVHFMNGLLNQQTKSFFLMNEFISLLATGTLDLLCL